MALLALAPVPVAAAPDRVHCSFEARFRLTPGLSVIPGGGEFTSGGQTGAISCQGTLSMGPATGPGPFGAQGRYGTGTIGDTCQTGGEGVAVQSFTVPTAGGPVPVTNPITFRYGIATGQVMGGTFHGDSYSGTFEIASFEGDCVVNPMTVVVLRGEGLLSA